MLDKKWIANFEKISRQHRLETLKRWGQEKCERCGSQLETVFDQNGKNPIRICWPCEIKDRDEEEKRDPYK